MQMLAFPGLLTHMQHQDALRIPLQCGDDSTLVRIHCQLTLTAGCCRRSDFQVTTCTADTTVHPGHKTRRFFSQIQLATFDIPFNVREKAAFHVLCLSSVKRPFFILKVCCQLKHGVRIRLNFRRNVEATVPWCESIASSHSKPGCCRCSHFQSGLCVIAAHQDVAVTLSCGDHLFLPPDIHPLLLVET